MAGEKLRLLTTGAETREFEEILDSDTCVADYYSKTSKSHPDHGGKRVAN